MPLYKSIIKEAETNTQIAVWQVTEPESFFAEHIFPSKDIAHNLRRLEHLAAKYLLKTINPSFPFKELKILPGGKPIIEDESLWFSLSHSLPYVAAAICPEYSVGVDIQSYKEKLPLLKSKFLSSQELALIPNTLEDLTVAWSVKEATFKWFGVGGLDFKHHMPIITYHRDGQKVFVEIDFNKDTVNQTVRLKANIEPDFVLAYTI